ncbi:GNAT family N-acetyltransferase [Bdellovibrionales bacterium]|nr:GNAT family N-acetyltransferase [Bdellovibrionales bacterium]
MSDYVISKAVESDCKEITEVHIASWRSTYSGLISAEYLNALDCGVRTEMWRSILSSNDCGVVFVVRNEGVLIGFFHSGKGRDIECSGYSEIYAIYLLKEYHGKGIGKAMMSYCFEQLKSVGYSNIYLWILHNNPTLLFYRKLGGTIGGSRDIAIGDQTYREIMVKF